jgi:8-oxo-dGTP diphosphatase
MEKARQEVMRLYGNRLRLRVCGVCINDHKVLMLSHRGIGQAEQFWCPPGGGAQFGETTHEALKREFLEETGLEIEVGDLLVVNEFMQPPLHALELFFEVKIVNGIPKIGKDPEMPDSQQIIHDMRWMSIEEIKRLPALEVHSIFKYCQELSDIYHLQGYLKN